MKDEIKEILDDLKDKCKYIEDYGYQYKRLSLEDADLLLDYITNLQEEKEKFKEYARNYLKSKIESKNNELELVKTKFIEEHNICYDYKSRCEKAIEYIKNINERAYKDDYETCFSTNDLLNILQGVGKDE